MASCVRNIRTKNYQNKLIGFQVTIENVGDVFFEIVYSSFRQLHGAVPVSVSTVPLHYRVCQLP